MQNYENKYILNNIQLKQNIISYFRYVDDTFILFKGTNHQANSMLSNLNKINKNIQFTLDYKKNTK